MVKLMTFHIRSPSGTCFASTVEIKTSDFRTSSFHCFYGGRGLTLLIFTGKCNLLGYVMLGLGLEIKNVYISINTNLNSLKLIIIKD